MKKILSLVVAGFVFLSIPNSQAAMSPIGIAIVPPVQFPGHDFSVTGLRASVLWGNQRNVYGLDVGVVGNMTDGQNTGISASGLFNYNKGATTAVFLQGAGFGNFNVGKAQVYGVQVAGVMNQNRAESSIWGVQAALLNLGPYTNVRGVQVGLYNRAHDVAGFQIGLVNFYHQGMFSVAPILNVGF